MSTGYGRPQRDHWAQRRKGNYVERLTDAEIDQLRRWFRNEQRVIFTTSEIPAFPDNGLRALDELTTLREQLRLANVDWAMAEAERNSAVDELRTLRATHAEVLGTVRELQRAARTIMHRDSFLPLIYGEYEKHCSLCNGLMVNEFTDFVHAEDCPWLALVALAQEATDAPSR